MKKTLLAAYLVVVCFFSIYSQPTDSLTGPRVWLNADRSTLSATRWSDIGFFKNDAVGASSTTTPSSFGIINFNKSLIFDGIDDYLKIPYSLEGLSELSILAVFQSSDTTERGIWGA